MDNTETVFQLIALFYFFNPYVIKSQSDKKYSTKYIK